MKIILLFIFLFSFPFISSQSKFKIDSLSWFAGCWESRTGNETVVSEQWMMPLGNQMLGMGRTVKNGKAVEYEFVRLELSDDGSINYIAHPSGQEEASFKLVKLEENEAVFENLSHDFPQRIIYRLANPDSLFAKVEGTINGKEESAEFPYRKVSCE